MPNYSIKIRSNCEKNLSYINIYLETSTTKAKLILGVGGRGLGLGDVLLCVFECGL